MPSAVLDASAVLAFMLDEKGADAVLPLIGDAVISTVNMSEVLTKLIAADVPPKTARAAFDGLFLTIANFTPSQAEAAALLARQTMSQGLSLGDRACLALAREQGLPAVTADRAWAAVETGVDVRLIR